MHPAARRLLHRRPPSLRWVAALCLLLGLLLLAGPGRATPKVAVVSAHADALGLADGLLSRYKLDSWQADQGLPISAVHTVLQTRDGRLWLGTGGGLAQFDGLKFTEVHSAEVPALSRRPIFGLMEDREGRLWIGHAGGAARWHKGHFSTVLDASLVNNRRIWGFAQAPDGGVWGASDGGLVHWPAGNPEGAPPQVFKTAQGLPTDRLRAVAFDRDGTLWIGTSGGGLVKRSGDRFEVLGTAQGFPHAEVRHLLADPAGGIWATTPGSGLVHLGPQGQRIYTVADGLPSNQLTHLSRDASGAMWIGTWGAGVSRWDGQQFRTLGLKEGLGGEQIWSVHADLEGSIWVGSWNGGLNRLRPRGFPVVGQPEGLAGDNTRSVIAARNGALWVSTAGGGISRVSPGRIDNLGLKEGLPSLEMSALFEDPDGSLWLGSYTNGVSHWRDGRITTYGTDAGLPHVEVRSILRDRAGTLWVGTRSGLARWKDGRFEALTEPGSPSEGVITLFEDRAGTLWIGTTGEGLFSHREGRFSRLTRKEGLSSNWIMALYEDQPGSLWIGTNGEGLNRLKDGRVSAVRPTEGLWDGLAQVFLPDRHGRLWMTCNRGFYWVSLKELHARADGRIERVQSTGYGLGEALRSPTFSGGLQPAGAADAQGFLWLPSVKGLVRVDPDQLPSQPEPPPVRMVAASALGQPLPMADGVVLPAGEASALTLRWAVGSVLHAQRVQLRYRLEGLSPDWIEVAGQRETTFPALGPGPYQFTLASSLDGQTWREGDTLAITVEPRLVQARWFQLLVGLALLVAAGLAYKLHTRRLHQRQLDMQRLVDERTEALRQANEELSRLSFSDALTGLPNRRRFDQQLDLEWRRTARQGVPLALILVDVDHFKAYNDALGHSEGDACLRDVAEIIRSTASRAGDFAARFGGEEFVLLIPGLDLTAACLYAERLRAACEARALPHPASAVGPVITISLGVAAWVPRSGLDAAVLFDAADAALYRAKASGRNCVDSANAPAA